MKLYILTGNRCVIYYNIGDFLHPTFDGYLIRNPRKTGAKFRRAGVDQDSFRQSTILNKIHHFQLMSRK